MARVNYSFEKRKRELDRKSKKAAKAEQRAKEGGSRANDGVPLEPLTGPVIPNFAEEDAKTSRPPGGLIPDRPARSAPFVRLLPRQCDQRAHLRRPAGRSPARNQRRRSEDADGGSHHQRMSAPTP